MGVANRAHGTADSKWAESVTQASKQAASSTVDRKWAQSAAQEG